MGSKDLFSCLFSRIKSPWSNGLNPLGGPMPDPWDHRYAIGTLTCSVRVIFPYYLFLCPKNKIMFLIAFVTLFNLGWAKVGSRVFI